MIRNLRTLLLAAVAATALSAVAASGASAAEFTAEGQTGKNTTLTVLPDGTGKTAHQVFDIRKTDGTGVLSITCNEAAGDATVAGESATQITFETLQFQTNCNFAGQSVQVKNTGCDFLFTAGSPQLHIIDDTSLKCEHGVGAAPIHFENTNLNCKVEVGRQTVTGIKYHNLPDGTITVEAPEVAVEYTATGSGCPYGTHTNGLFTTGNAIVTGEDTVTGNMVNIKHIP